MTNPAVREKHQPVTEPIVARSDRSMLAPLAIGAPEPVDLAALVTTDRISDALRQPIRLLNTVQPPLGLRDLVHHTLVGFGHPSQGSDPLFLLMVQLLAERQSNAYIEAALQLAFDRGRITLPVTLIGPGGRVDVDTLLGGLIYMNAVEHGIPTAVAEARRIAPEGSLAAMISR